VNEGQQGSGPQYGAHSARAIKGVEVSGVRVVEIQRESSGGRFPQHELALLVLQLHFPQARITQMQAIGIVLECCGCACAKPAAAVPPDESARVQEQVHASSDVRGEFLQRRIEVGCSLHGNRMQGSYALARGLSVIQALRRRLADALTQPLLPSTDWSAACAAFGYQAGRVVIQLDRQRAHIGRLARLSQVFQPFFRKHGGSLHAYSSAHWDHEPRSRCVPYGTYLK